METACYFEKIDDPRLEETIHQWQDLWPDGGCFAMVAEANKAEIPALQNKFNHINYPVIGAMFPELIVHAHFKSSGILLLLMTHQTYYQLLANTPAEDNTLSTYIRAFTDKLGKKLNTENESNSLFLIFDGMLPNIATILEQTYSQLGNKVHYFGVNAGSETFKPAPCLFDNQNFIGNGLIALLLPKHPGAILAHSYRQPEIQMTATSTDGNRINSIEGRPAFDVYQEFVELHYGVVITVENLYEYGVHFPFGIIRKEGEPLVRIPVDVQEDGSLHCVGEVPPNTSLTLLKAVSAGSNETIETIASHPQLSSGELVLNFYCAGRRLHLGKEAQTELKALADRLSPQTIMGAISLGEIGSSVADGHPYFHNAALLTAPWLK